MTVPVVQVDDGYRHDDNVAEPGSAIDGRPGMKWWITYLRGVRDAPALAAYLTDHYAGAV